MASLGTSRFKVHLRRARGPGKRPIRAKIVTQAKSPAQARRFAHVRKPGFTATTVERE